MPAAALLAGALALAGCGGGSSNTTDSGGTPPPPPPSGDPKGVQTADVPDDKTVAGGFAGIRLPLEAGETKFVSPWWYTCESGSCLVEVARGDVVSKVSYTGTGKLTIRDSDHRLPSSTAEGDAQPTENTSPLSHATLFKTLSGKATVWRATSSTDLPGTDLVYESGGKKTTLNAKSLGGTTEDLKEDGDYIYWGLWADSTTEPGSGKVTHGAYGAVMGGGKPYGKKPENSIASATYKDANAIVHYRESDKEDWIQLPDPNAATLEANFSTGKIGGKVETPMMFGTVNGKVGNIFLRDTDIGSDGKFSGMSEAQHSKRQSGQWNGEFFGDTTKVVDVDPDNRPGSGDEYRKTDAKAPSHASATFSVNRPEIKADGQDALIIRGAFGSACSTAGC